jgi:hypothetical protein
MQIPINKILSLLEIRHPPGVRAAAVLVLGELGQRDDEIADAVVAALADEDSDVRLRAIGAAGKLRVDKALPRLAERIRGGGAEAERAAEAAARLGAKGSKLLHELMPQVAPGLRRYIAKALAGAGASTGGDVSELEILLDKDPAVVGAAVQSLAATIPNLDARRKKMVADELLELAGGKNAKLSNATEAGVIRLAGLLDDDRVAPLLWDRIVPPYSREVRATALTALGKWAASPSKEQRGRLFQCAAAGDFQVAAPALMILDKLPLTEKLLPEWLPLFRAHSVAARRLALAKVGDRDSPEIAEALLEQINHPDRAFREEALDRLSRGEHGRRALAKRFHEAETADEAWPLARVVARFAPADPEAWTDELFPKASQYLEAGDRRADALLFVLRECGAGRLRERLEKRAVVLVGKKAFDKAYQLYRAIVRDPSAGFSYRLGATLCELKLSPKELAPEARAQDHCLSHFAELARQDEAAVLAQLEKTAWLEAEELHYLGFHFIEAQEEGPRAFGAAVLQLLLKRYGKNKLARAAKNKLEAAGLGGKPKATRKK